MKSRLLIIVLFLGIGAVLVGWIYESQTDFRLDRSELEIPQNIDYFMTDLTYRVMTDAGKLDYEFSSPRLEHHNLGDFSRIEQPFVQLYRDSQHWQIDSRQGEFQHADNLLWLSQQVVMQRLGENPLQIYGESIRFSPDRDLLVSDSAILMQSANSRIEAQQAVFDLSTRVYTLQKTRAVYTHGKS